MKQIKFRAWQKYHKRMVEVTSISFDDNGEINGVATFVENQAPQHVNYRDDLLGGFFLKDERGMVLELMQYTGLEDKNGVEIYEGDIVKVISGHGWDDVSDVVFGLTDKRYGNYPAFCMPRVETESNSFSEVFDSGDYEVEVIGNIYQNKDLLEG